MFRLPFGERVDPLEEKRQARQNTINNVLTFFMLCAAIRVGKSELTSIQQLIVAILVNYTV